MPQAAIIKGCDLIQRYNVARIKLDGVLEGSCSFFVAALLATLNETYQLVYARIIRQPLAREFQFSQSAIIITMSLIKILRTREMRFTCIRTQASRRVNSRFPQCQA